jgi:hypothetical protein
MNHRAKGIKIPFIKDKYEAWLRWVYREKNPVKEATDLYNEFIKLNKKGEKCEK